RLEGSVALHGTDVVPELALAYRPDGASGFLDWAPPSLGAARADDQGTLRARFSSELALPAGGTLVLSLPEDAAGFDNGVRFVLPDAPRRAQVLYLGDGNRPLELALLANADVELYSASALPAD